MGEQELLSLTPDQWAELEKEKDEEGNRYCASEVLKRYNGARCMGKTVHAHVPNNADLTHNFFFDERYFLDCHQTTSKAKKATLPGSCYFKYLSAQEQTVYRCFNNVLEGLRTDGPFRCPHPINRVPAPVPNTADSDGKGNWHYYTLNDLPREFMDVTKREINDFCPVVQLNTCIQSLGEPDVHTHEDADGYLCTTDKNQTWQKIVQLLPGFVHKFTGKDLEEVTTKTAEDIYIRLLKKSSKKLEKLNIKLSQKNLTAIQMGVLKIKLEEEIVKCRQHAGCQCKKMGGGKKVALY